MGAGKSLWEREEDAHAQPRGLVIIIIRSSPSSSEGHVPLQAFTSLGPSRLAWAIRPAQPLTGWPK
jgi:hypothetical protein